MSSNPRRVLLVEDEYFIAQDTAHELGELGMDVIGPIGRLAEALARATAEPLIDAAVLDINLGGEMVFPLVDLLLTRGVPVIFMTGYNMDGIPARYEDIARCTKPLKPNSLKEQLATVLGS